MARPTDSERQEDRLMDLGHNYGPSFPLMFVVPRACKSQHKRNEGNDDKAPGIYLPERSHGGNDQVSPIFRGRLLSKDEALEFAAAFDKLTKPQPYSSGPSDRGVLPGTHVELVEAFYETLGRRLERAVKDAESRAGELREVRAALTGKVGTD